jgi:hypothetical protein
VLLALALPIGLAFGLAFLRAAATDSAGTWGMGPALAPMGDPLVQSPPVSVVNMLRQRFETLMDGDLERIRLNYATDELRGEYALLKEEERTAYFRSWLAERGLTLESASAWFEIDSVMSLGRNSYRMEITEHATYTYRAVAGQLDLAQTSSQARSPTASPTHTFGSRTVHVLETVFEDGRWKIAYDWYADPLGDGPVNPGKGRITPHANGTQSDPNARVPDVPDSSAPSQRFNREKAAQYALRHSGVRSLPGGGKYNRDYQVYSYVGGDCANFASQVLAAGGLPQGYGWAYSRGGTSAWTCSQDLIWYLTGSGAGRRLYRGDFAGALLPLPDSTRGAISLLQPGDIIGYESGGEVVHVAVVVGVDPYGWPIIASHTADRLYFPWDLGWDQDTVFWFIQIVY